MASFTPYTYIQCPCHESAIKSRATADDAPSTRSRDLNDDDDDGHAFDPRAPRSNFSLYPLEYLFYCEDCHQIRCPRCVSEELATIYCPSCLFEVGSSSLKTEGNRCTRSCFQCPICIGPLVTQALETYPDPSLLSADAAAATPASSGPWILTCTYCNWNSAEIGVKFDKPQGIFAQLQKIRYGDEQHAKHLVSSSSNSNNISGDNTSSSSSSSPQDYVPETNKARFAALKSFYGSQAANANPSAGLSGLAGDYGLNSPGALTRIMSLYSGNNVGAGGGGGGLKQKHKPRIMREADTAAEGFRASDLDLDGEDGAALARLRREGWHGTVTAEQARNQLDEAAARFADELWPIPALLRTKRSKRCPACRHIISKPESKVGNTRWRIRLVAKNYIPSISVKPLTPSPTPTPTANSGSGSGSGLLQPLQPTQFLLTFKNPLFDDVKVTLATPATTPGRFASRVTVLCPEFQIDANTDTDMYLDDVLKDGDRDRDRERRRGREDEGSSSHGGAEPGKVWERGRNWVSIVVEVIPASLRIEPPPAIFRKEGDPEPDLSPLKEDEDILEIPMFVRLEWEGEASHENVGGPISKDKDATEKKELAYWCAIGIGRISQE